MHFSFLERELLHVTELITSTGIVRPLSIFAIYDLSYLCFILIYTSKKPDGPILYYTHLSVVRNIEG